MSYTTYNAIQTEKANRGIERAERANITSITKAKELREKYRQEWEDAGNPREGKEWRLFCWADSILVGLTHYSKWYNRRA
tara:strand:+ start:2020 stop:2259 length:240 start_codon:yes stop_codon:yes gene_type:complete